MVTGKTDFKKILKERGFSHSMTILADIVGYGSSTLKGMYHTDKQKFNIIINKGIKDFNKLKRNQRIINRIKT